MRINRREFGAIVAGAALLPVPATAAVDYGDPDMEFRAYRVHGVPSSGLHHPLRADGEKWCARLGLPMPDQWGVYRNMGSGVQKVKLREACHRWIADHSYRCQMADLF